MKKGNRAVLLALLLPVAGFLGGYPSIQAGPQAVSGAFLDQPLPAPREEAGPSIILYERHGHVTPIRKSCQHTGGGNIDVTRPSADTVIVTMKGAAVAHAHPWQESIAAQEFDLV